MPAADKSPAIIELEREILRQLCSAHGISSRPADTAASRAKTIADLSTYAWHDAEHRVVFEALVRLPGRDATELQRQLPAQATRMGFPDVQWEAYLDRGATSRGDRSAEKAATNLASLVASLRAASREAAS
ncbi:MAG: hypothetical protein WA211_00480 [Candidatus Acidiferrales bacterium]